MTLTSTARLTRGPHQAGVPASLGLGEAPQAVRVPVPGALLVCDSRTCREGQVTRAPLHCPAAWTRVRTVAPGVLHGVVERVHCSGAPQRAVVVTGGALSVHLAPPLEGEHAELARSGSGDCLATWKSLLVSIVVILHPLTWLTVRVAVAPPPVDVLAPVVEAGAAPGQPRVVRRGAGRVLDALVGEGEHAVQARVCPADGGGGPGAGGGRQDEDQEEQGEDGEGRGRQGPLCPLVEVAEVNLNKPGLVLPLPQSVYKISAIKYCWSDHYY